MCARRMQNRMGLFSTATKLFVWRLRLRVQKAQPLQYWNWVVNTYNLLTNTNIWGFYWILSSQMTKTFRDNCDINIVQQTRCGLFSRCSNAVKNVLFRSFCTPMYASQSWCNFRKSCMQRLRVAYNFGCRALYNLPWRASVSSQQVQCNIPTFEALLRKYKYLFVERCRKSNNVWLRATNLSHFIYSSRNWELAPYSAVVL